MPTKKSTLQQALEKGQLKTRPLMEIDQDQLEAIQWAEDVARHFPVRIRRGRPVKEDQSGPSRSVTVRFPEVEAELILSTAKSQGLSISEFVRAAAFHAASPMVPKRSQPAKASPPCRPGPVKH
jgi:hypothetical protein